jgi:hypothetical protein
MISLSLKDGGELIGKTVSDVPKYYCIRVENDNDKGYRQKVVFCRVANFLQEEGNIAMPEWMFETLEVEQGQTIIFREVIVSKGKAVTLKPHSNRIMDVLGDLDISETLSPLLSSYGCLSKDTTIRLSLFDEEWKFDVVSVVNCNDKKSRGISTIDVDLDTDFTVMKTVPPSPTIAPTQTPIASEEAIHKAIEEASQVDTETSGRTLTDNLSAKPDDGLTDYERAREARMKMYETKSMKTDEDVENVQTKE